MGVWTLPYKRIQISKLKKLLNEYEGDMLVEKTLYQTCGNDALFDELVGLNRRYADGIKKAVQRYLKYLIADYEKHPDEYRGKLDVAALKELLRAK